MRKPLSTLLSITSCACGVLWSASVYAQPPTGQTPEQPEAEPDAVPRDWTVGLGLGVMKFSGGTADGAADIGASYDVRAGFRTHALVGVEAAYIGSSQSITALGLDPDAKIRSHGIEAVARLSLENVAAANLGPMRIEPFLFGGLAFQRFTLVDEGTNTSNVAAGDNVIAIPIGAGASGRWGRVDVDTRVTWRRTFDNDMFRTPAGTRADAALSHWTLGARAGVEF
jgi:hypothetical protein